MERPAGRRVVDQLDGANLDDAVTVQRIKTGCLGVDDDFTHKKSSSCVPQFTQRLQPAAHNVYGERQIARVS